MADLFAEYLAYNRGVFRLYPKAKAGNIGEMATELGLHTDHGQLHYPAQVELLIDQSFCTMRSFRSSLCMPWNNRI